MTRKKQLSVLLIAAIGVAALLTGCSDSDKTADGKTIVELVHYKPEAVDVFEQLEAEFNATHDDVQLKIESPNDAMTILKTRFTREDYPDIIGIGGDINYSYFVDADILRDISDYEGLADIKSSYVDILEGLSSFLQRVHMAFLMWQMPPEFFITGICLKSMDGKSRRHGTSS